LTIDVAGDAGLFGAWPEIIGWYQSLYRRIKKANFRLRQIAVCV
jgi:hypothetical protein